MKNLQDFMHDAQTQLFQDTNAFFAFSQEQFNEGKKEGVQYVSMGGGLLCEKQHAKTLVNGLNNISKKAIEQDLAENGKETIIRRELYNHECFYTGSIDNCVEKLENYPITKDEIMLIYKSEYNTAFEKIE